MFVTDIHILIYMFILVCVARTSVSAITERPVGNGMHVIVGVSGRGAVVAGHGGADADCAAVRLGTAKVRRG